MATPTNRSPWQVKLAGKDKKLFRLKSQAIAHLAEMGYSDPEKLPKGALRQLETAFEVQIKYKDKAGNEAKRSQTHDTYQLAKDWAESQEALLKKIRQQQGGFEASFETITIKDALEKFHKEHYAGMASFDEIGYRITHLTEWLGPDKLLRDLNKRDFTKLRDTFEKDKNFSGSHTRNYFTVLTSLYRHAANEWHYPVENPAAGITLRRPNNAKQRFWVGNEQERLIASINARSPWLIPIVELSLAMAFRRGELVQTGKNKKTGKQSGGLRWENIDWENNILSLPKEKNDKTKRVTEYLGRRVPLTAEMRSTLLPLYERNPTKSGLVFSNTTNSVTTAFSHACEKADPPILDLTFHSMRKIATKNLSRRVNNAMELSRLSGHKNIEVLNSRYYDVQVEDLRALLAESSGTLHHRGITALTKVLGLPDARKFVNEIRAMKTAAEAFK
jgi:integrase